MKIEKVSIDKLLLDPANARKHGKKNLDSIKGSLAKFGQQKPIVVNADNVIVAGNGTLQAAKELGWKEISIVRTDLKGSDITAFGIADNRTSELAEWDDKVLSELLEGLKAEDFDLSAIGFDIDDMNEMIGDKNKAGLTDPDDVPEPPKVPKTKLGNHRLMCGDSTDAAIVEKLMAGQKADVVFTDPHYGYSYESNHQRKHSVLMNDDKLLDFAPACFSAMSEDSAIFVCGSFQTIARWIEYVARHFDYKNLIVWKKNNWSMGDLKGAFAGQHELIIFAHKGRVELIGGRDPDVWSFDRCPPKIHPTQKPVELIEYAIGKVKSDVVLDLFGGSGSSLIACEKVNKEARMMELDPKYCDVIIKRWEDFTGKKAVLISEN